jgi:hypothetical protein
VLDFYLIRDDQPNNYPVKHLAYLGGIEADEFEEAQCARVIETHLDYYGKFRWSSELIRMKLDSLTKSNHSSLLNLTTILRQALAADCGLAAFGD